MRKLREACGIAVLGILGIVGGLLGGCAPDVTPARPFNWDPLHGERLMNSEFQWNRLAEATADDRLAPDLPESCASKVLIASDPADGVFSRAFKNMLTAHLAKVDVEVSTMESNDPNECLIEVHADVVRHAHLTAPPWGFSLLGTVLGFAVYSAREAFHVSPLESIAVGSGLGIAYDVSRYLSPSPTDTEVFVSTTVSQNHVVQSADSEVFYIPNADAQAFQNSAGAEAESEARKHPKHAHATYDVWGPATGGTIRLKATFLDSDSPEAYIEISLETTDCESSDLVAAQLVTKLSADPYFERAELKAEKVSPPLPATAPNGACPGANPSAIMLSSSSTAVKWSTDSPLLKGRAVVKDNRN
jgi:hypothetical protein